MEENEQPQGVMAALARVAIKAIERTAMVVETAIHAIRPPTPPDPDVVLTKAFFDLVRAGIIAVMESRERQYLRQEKEEERKAEEEREPFEEPRHRGQPIKRAELLARSFRGLDGRRILHWGDREGSADVIIAPEHVIVIVQLPDDIDPSTIRVGASPRGLFLSASGDRLRSLNGRPYDDEGEPTPFSVGGLIVDSSFAERPRNAVEYTIRGEEFFFDRMIVTYEAPNVAILIPRVIPIKVFPVAIIAPSP